MKRLFMSETLGTLQCYIKQFYLLAQVTSEQENTYIQCYGYKGAVLYASCSRVTALLLCKNGIKSEHCHPRTGKVLLQDW